MLGAARRDVDPAEAAAEFHEALVGGDLETAADLAVQIENSTPDPGAATSALVNAVGNGRVQRARTLYGTALRSYEALGAREAERAVQARTLQNDPSVALSDRQSGGEFFPAITTARIRRAKFLGGAAVAVSIESPTDHMREDLPARREELRTADEAAAGAASAVASAVNGYDFPPTVAVSAVRFDGRQLPVDGTGGVEVTLANVGDETAKGVSLRTRTDDGLAVVNTGGSVGSLDAGDRVDRTLRVRGEATGRHGLTVGVTASNGTGDAGSVQVPVVDHLPLALAVDADDDGLIDTGEMQRAVEFWAAGDPVPGTDGTVPSEEDVRKLLVLWSRNLPV